jgi:hypothetical protein
VFRHGSLSLFILPDLTVVFMNTGLDGTTHSGMQAYTFSHSKGIFYSPDVFRPK